MKRTILNRGAIFLMAMLLAACAENTVVGRFGPYHERPKQLRLADGDTLVVYRVKYWNFTDGTPPALQLEYEAPVSVMDTASLRKLAYRIWPAFAPYVENAKVTNAILTATNLRRDAAGTESSPQLQHFGLIAHRDSAGAWRLQRDGAPLPPAETGASPRIFEGNGQPMAVTQPWATIGGASP